MEKRNYIIYTMAVSLLEIMTSFLNLCFWQERLVLLLLGYDKFCLKPIKYALLLPLFHRGTLFKKYTHVYNDLTIAATFCCANGCTFRVTNPLLTCFICIGKHFCR